ncbi:hypothetical protein [Dactylosporangium sp. CA-139066]|uniref:hypothetical protein n=1 Tax=Dactylosporangium sp. CA-139066 TaxID=3239930 RepID=UPI003D8C5E05
MVPVRYRGGALAGPAHGPHGSLAELYALHLFGLPGDGVVDRQRDLAAALPVSGRKPMTFLAWRRTSPRPTRSPRTLSPACAIKAARDPGNVFRSNFPVNC